METSFSYRGYGIPKKDLSEKKILAIKKKLTVAPFQPGNFGPPPKSFSLFLESPSKIYLPRYFGLQKFGKPVINKQESGLSLGPDVKFNGQLRQKYRREAQHNLLMVLKKHLVVAINLPCGYGKTILALSLITHPEIQKNSYSCS